MGTAAVKEMSGDAPTNSAPFSAVLVAHLSQEMENN